jgi:hypothetical protein
MALQEEPHISKPIPDPTEKTVDLIDRVSVADMRVIITRFSAMDKALELLQDQANRLPSIAQVSGSVDALKELIIVRLDAIQNQFRERDTRNDKQEVTFIKLLDTMDGKINVLKDTTNLLTSKLENRVGAVETTKNAEKAVWGYIAIAVGLALNAAALIFHH